MENFCSANKQQDSICGGDNTIMAKPDNRKDNVEHLQNATENTIENYQEAEDYLEEFGDEISVQEKTQIHEKNERRKHSISGFHEEIKDEANHQQNS